MQDQDLAQGSEVSMAAVDEARFADVHPDLLSVALTAPQFELTPEALPFIRTAMNERAAERAAEADGSTRRETVTIPGRDGHPDVGALIYRRADHQAGGPVILSLHGGGFLLGNAETTDRANRQWARDTGCTIVSIDYRLAPDHSYPAPMDDAMTALLWIAEQASAQGWDAGRILVKGDSAGGGLAAGLALLTRDRGGPAIAAQILIYPMLDDRTRAEPHRAGNGTLVWPCDSNQFAWTAYLGGEPGDTVPPYAIPARATDLTGLPPTFIGTGTLDLFYREDIDYARRLMEAGVPVATYVAQGAFHGFDTMAPDAGVTRAFVSAMTASLAFLLAR